MDCKQIQRRIPAFLRNELKKRELIRFLKHMETCEECKEELTIQYLSSEGILRLEEGLTFDLDRELSEYMIQTKKAIKRRRNIVVSILVFELLAIAVIAMICIYANI